MARREFISVASALVMGLALTLPVAQPGSAVTGVGAVGPAAGSSGGGTAITITGGDFMPGGCTAAQMTPLTSVTVDPGGTPAVATNVVVVSDTSITAVTAAHPAGGPFIVRVAQGAPAGGCTGASTSFDSPALYTHVNPTATSVGPPSGPAGSTISIFGSSMQGTTDVRYVGPLGVSTASTSDTGTPVVATGGGSVTSVAPASLAPGTYSIVLVNASGAFAQSASFTVLAPTPSVGPSPFPTLIGGFGVTVTVTASPSNSAPCGLVVGPSPTFTLSNASAPGSALAGVSVVIVSVIDANTARAAVTDANGVATFGGMTPGIYRITSADSTDFVPVLLAGLDMAFGGPAGHLIDTRVASITGGANVPVALVCRTAPLIDLLSPTTSSVAFGQVVDYFTGLPIVGAPILVNVNAGTAANPQPGTQIASVLTDANGRWVTPEIPAGPYVARVAASLGLNCVLSGINLCADAFQLVPAGVATAIPTPTPMMAPTSTLPPTGAAVVAQMVAPAPGSVLPSSTVTFSWTGGTGATQYWLWVSTILGDGNLYTHSQETSLSATVSGIPRGAPVYVRLWSLVSASWLYIDYPYGPGVATSTPAAIPTLATTPTMTPTPSPTPTVSATLAATSAGTATIAPTATNTPTPTATLPLTATSTSGAVAVALAQMVAPAPGSVVPSSTVTFSWTGGTGVTQYWLWVGTVLGDGNLYSQSQGTSLSVTVSGIPTGVPVHVRLWSLVSGIWQYIDYPYGPGVATSTPAASPPPAGTPTIAPTATNTVSPTMTSTPGAAVLAEMVTPAPGSALTSPMVTFSWTSGTGVTQYWLWVSTVPGDGNVYTQSQGTSLSVTVSGVPTTGTVYVRLWSLMSGDWQYRDYNYGTSG